MSHTLSITSGRGFVATIVAAGFAILATLLVVGLFLWTTSRYPVATQAPGIAAAQLDDNVVLSYPIDAPEIAILDWRRHIAAFRQQ